MAACVLSWCSVWVDWFSGFKNLLGKWFRVWCNIHSQWNFGFFKRVEVWLVVLSLSLIYGRL